MLSSQSQNLLLIHTDMSVALMQHENGTPQRSTLGLEQLKYSFFPQSKYPS